MRTLSTLSLNSREGVPPTFGGGKAPHPLSRMPGEHPMVHRISHCRRSGRANGSRGNRLRQDIDFNFRIAAGTLCRSPRTNYRIGARDFKITKCEMAAGGLTYLATIFRTRKTPSHDTNHLRWSGGEAKCSATWRGRPDSGSTQLFSTARRQACADDTVSRIRVATDRRVAASRRYPKSRTRS